jgi:hypothetical protein
VRSNRLVVLRGLRGVCRLAFGAGVVLPRSSRGVLCLRRLDLGAGFWIWLVNVREEGDDAKYIPQAIIGLFVDLSEMS